MKITLAEAAHDENNQLGYEAHALGDQTGDEVRFHDYYNKLWTRAYRPLNADFANAIAIRMEQAVRNPKVGYGQPTRSTFVDVLLKNSDPSQIIFNVDCDCSSLVNPIVKVTYRDEGITLPITGYETTGEMVAKYDLMTNYFKNVISEVDLATGKGLKRGDILVRPYSHTAVVLQVEEDVVLTRTGTVTTGLYMRADAGVFHKVILTLPKDAKVEILGEKKILTGLWYQIRYNGRVGYASAKYIK